MIIEETGVVLFGHLPYTGW